MAIEFGVMYSRFYPGIGPGEFAAMLQSTGFDSAWMGEGPASTQPALDPFLTLTAMALAAERIRIGSCVVLVPIRNPVLLAKEVATIDILSGGRFVFGIGVGASGMADHGAYDITGTDPRTRGARCDEYLDLMTALWRGDPVTHHGRFYALDGMAIAPRPRQRPHPPIWAGGDAEGMLRRAGRFGDGFVPVAAGPADYAARWGRIERYAREAGRDPAGITRALHLYYHCADAERSAAHAEAERNLAARYGHPVSFADDGRFAFGDAEACAATIAAYRDVGVTHFVLNLACPIDEVPAALGRFAEEVMPRFRS